MLMTKFETDFAPANKYDANRLPFAKRLEDLRPGECIWPINSGGPYLFCAAKTDGKKYCAHHKARLLQKRSGQGGG